MDWESKGADRYGPDLQRGWATVHYPKEWTAETTIGMPSSFDYELDRLQSPRSDRPDLEGA